MAVADPRLPTWTRELLGALAALAIGIALVAIVASSPRVALLLDDGDSLVTTLVVRSFAVGQPQDWAMSTVLFLPEIAVLGVLSALGLGVDGTLLLAAVVNVLALYGALRLASGARTHSRAPVAGALLALGAFALVCSTEASAERNAWEPASLLLTTTYYSATVIGVVVAVGLARRGIESGRARHVWVLAAVAAASVLTNPLFAAWAAVPLAVVLGVVIARSPRSEPRRARAVWLVGAVTAGSLAGFIARLPVGDLIANTGAGYADPSRWLESAGYYAALAIDRLSEPWGVLAATAGLALWAWSGVASVRLARRRLTGAAVAAAFGWIAPLIVVVGAVVLGTNAARYLQPMAFAPLLGLVVLPELLPRGWRLSSRASPVLVAATATAVVLASVIGVPRIAAAATAPDDDLACVVEWTDASGRTGAGQFWTIRLPKTHAADPRSLVQVDHELRGYAWLVNRDDFAVGEVTFLVIDSQSVDFALPDGRTMTDASDVAVCGRYTIVDFGDRPLPIGPQRS